MTDAPVAAIDMGTNSTRLLVHDGENTIERLMTITRLGQDVDRTGRLADDLSKVGHRDRRPIKIHLTDFNVAGREYLTPPD